MTRTEGAEVFHIRCINERRKRYSIAWDFQSKEDESGNYSYMEYTFDHLPTADEIREVIFRYYDEQTDAAILSGYTFGDIPVWLSMENQFNYKAAYDLAVQTQGESLPVRFKLGTNAEPQYHTFNTLADLEAFYTGALAFIQQTLEAGWDKKDAIDLDDYTVNS